ncbi:hypothetical protein [Kitasatospora sp. NPDC089509]|uniref:hypothetical protein n=1 Tax=Kitasatospora sp. NPDC089509 TaxID=3364079 RepID=UPI0038087290
MAVVARSQLWAHAEAEEAAAGLADDDQPRRPVPERLHRPVDPLGAEDLKLHECLGPA